MIADSVDCNVENKYKNLTSEDWRDDSHDKKCGTFRRHSSIDLESDIYDMNHENRGVAIIFDHYKFNSGKTPSPKQVKTDSKLLKETLQKLGFIVEVHSNCTKKEIKENLQRVADVDHQNNDCISIAVLSHGKAGRLEARDGSYAVNELWDILIETASLIGKPKLFFIQAYSDEIQKDSFVTTGSMVNYIKFPVVADLLVMSCEEHLGSLSRGKGSSFIQALCREFDDYGKTLEFLRLLARVNRKVSRFQSIESTNGKYTVQQMPSIVSTLTKNLYFTTLKDMESS